MRRARLGLLLSAVLSAAACTGTIGEAPNDEPKPTTQTDDACTGIEPGDSPIRRMTRTEYDNTVRDLLGDTTEPARDFVPEEEALGFNNQASTLGVTQILAEEYMDASEKIAARAVSHLDTLVGCDPKAKGDDVCATAFIASFGKRAFRRPLAPDEITRLQGVFTWGREQSGFATGIRLVIEAMLQSPHFLYRVELGMPEPVAPGVVKLGPWETASRLSYLLWNSMPDDELFAAAEGGRLATPKDIEAQARRMLDDPRARRAVENFHFQWLGLRNIETLNKDPATYPKYDPKLRPLWKDETLAFLDYVVFDGEGDLTTMLTAPYSMMNEELATFYGVSGPKGEGFERVSLDPDEHAGFLTQASVLAVNAKPNQSSPVHRGKFVREQLLCQLLPPPPNNIEIKAPDPALNATTRERFAEHSKNPACAGCHRLMDPVGFGFEHYDGIGLYRDLDEGLPIDASGRINGSEDVDGPFDGPVELAHELARSEQVRSCVTKQWFRFGYGRPEQEADTCSLRKVQDAFRASGYNIKELLVALTQTDAFLYRKATTGGTK
jgi:hypothetical protein